MFLKVAVRVSESCEGTSKGAGSAIGELVSEITKEKAKIHVEVAPLLTVHQLFVTCIVLTV